MKERMRRVGAIAKEYAEDLALSAGAACTAFGIAGAFGTPFGVLALGVLLLLYGAWLTWSGGRR